MSERRVCDRCGRAYMPGEEAYSVVKLEFGQEDTIAAFTLDLCPDDAKHVSNIVRRLVTTSTPRDIVKGSMFGSPTTPIGAAVGDTVADSIREMPLADDDVHLGTTLPEPDTFDEGALPEGPDDLGLDEDDEEIEEVD